MYPISFLTIARGSLVFFVGGRLWVPTILYVPDAAIWYLVPADWGWGRSNQLFWRKKKLYQTDYDVVVVPKAHSLQNA